MLGLLGFIGNVLLTGVKVAAKAVWIALKFVFLLLIGVFLLFRRHGRKKREQERMEKAYVKGRQEADALHAPVPAVPPAPAAAVEPSHAPAPAAAVEPPHAPAAALPEPAPAVPEPAPAAEPTPEPPAPTG